MSSRIPLAALALAVALPCLAGQTPPDKPVPAARVPKTGLTRVGIYEAWIDPLLRKPAGPMAAAADPQAVIFGLRLGAPTREDALRLEGINGSITVTDDVGRVHTLHAFPGRPSLDGKMPLSQDPTIRDYLLRLPLPDDRAVSLKSIEGELSFNEGPVHKLELTARELAEGAERKLDAFTVKVAPVKPGPAETEVALELNATLQGEAVTPERIDIPTLTVELQDSSGRLYASESARFQYSARGPGLSRGGSGSYSGAARIRLRPALLNALRLRGAPAPGQPLAPLPPRRAAPLPAEVTTHYESTLKFKPVHNDEELKSLTVYLMLPAPTPKTVPFRIENVRLPLPGGQQQP